MQLSKRLQMVASFVTPGNRLADIGTDHGYIPIFLVQKGICPSAIASDINKGPLLRAREHIRQSGLGDKIQTRLGNGLETILPGEADTILIAGMGGPLMTEILEQGKPVWDSTAELVLSPHSDIPRVRMYIMQNGYEMIREDMVKEDGKYYVVLKAIPAFARENRDRKNWDRKNWTLEEISYGRLLLRQQNPVLREYLMKSEKKLKNILAGLDGKEGDAACIRREQLRQEEMQIKKALEYYDTEGEKNYEVQ